MNQCKCDSTAFPALYTPQLSLHLYQKKFSVFTNTDQRTELINNDTQNKNMISTVTSPCWPLTDPPDCQSADPPQGRTSTCSLGEGVQYGETP